MLDRLEERKASKWGVDSNHPSVFRGCISHFLEMHILTNFDSMCVIETPTTYCPGVTEDSPSLSQAYHV